jgi:hypothetical protein
MKTTSILTALSAAAVATMLVAAPASAGTYGKKHYSHSYSHNHGKSAYWKWQKRKEARRHHHYAKPWWSRSYAWKYKAYRNW